MENSETESHVRIGYRVEKNDNNPYGWELVDAIDPNEVCVIVLGGSSSNGDREANGYAKSVENDIVKAEDMSDKVKVYGIAYNFAKDYFDEHSRAALLRKHKRIAPPNKYVVKQHAENPLKEEEHINPQYVKEIFDKIILPRISNLDGKVKLNTNEACKRLRKISIVAHCHGAYTALKVEELMQDKMKELGYTNEDREKIQKQMFVLAHAPACPLGVSKSTFVSLCSARDGAGAWHGNLLHNKIIRRTQEENKRFSAEKNGNEEDIAKNRKFDLKLSFLEGKKGNMFLVNHIYKEDPERGPVSIDMNDEHNFAGYKIKNDMTTDGQIMTYLGKTMLTNAIKNSITQSKEFTPLPTLVELAEDDKGKGVFAQAVKNGESFWNDISKEIKNDRAILRKNQRN